MAWSSASGAAPLAINPAEGMAANTPCDRMMVLSAWDSEAPERVHVDGHAPDKGGHFGFRQVVQVDPWPMNSRTPIWRMVDRQSSTQAQFQMDRERNL